MYMYFHGISNTPNIVEVDSSIRASIALAYNAEPIFCN